MGSGLLLLPADRSDRDVLRWVPSLLLRHRWLGHHPREWLHFCLWDPRDLQARGHPQSERWVNNSASCPPQVTSEGGLCGKRMSPTSCWCSGVLISALTLSRLIPEDLIVLSAGRLSSSVVHSFLPLLGADAAGQAGLMWNLLSGLI